MAVKRALAVAGLSAVETALVKCTYDDDEIPKKKHIKTISDYVAFELGGQGYYTSSSKEIPLVEMFRKRVNKLSNPSLSWKVVIKSLITIHILLRECNRSFTEEFIRNNGQSRVMSACANFFDSNSIAHSTFIRKYSRYLSQKLNVFKHLNLNVERELVQNNKDFFKKFDVDTLGKILVLFSLIVYTLISFLPLFTAQNNGTTSYFD